VRRVALQRSRAIRWRNTPAKELTLSGCDLHADDFAFGHEKRRGFQRVFEDAGGKVVQKIFTPLTRPTTATYLSQFKNADCLYTGHAGSNGLKIIRQISEYGLKANYHRGRLYADR